MSHKFNADCTEPKYHFLGGLLCALIVPRTTRDELDAKAGAGAIGAGELESQLPLDCLV